MMRGNKNDIINELKNAPNCVSGGYYFLRISHELRDDIIDLLNAQEKKITKLEEANVGLGDALLDKMFCK